MAFSVTMPALGESVTEGTVTRWLKKEGERVEVDEPLLEVSTDKVDTEIPSPVAGVVQSIKVQEDETVDVGVELAVIGDGAEGGGDAPAAAAARARRCPGARAGPRARAGSRSPSPSPPRSPRRRPRLPRRLLRRPRRRPPRPLPRPPPPPAAPAPAPAASGGSGSESAYVTPLVRKLASEHGVDLGSLQGTGVGGRIRKQDVLDAAVLRVAASSAPAPAQPAAPRPATDRQQIPTPAASPSAPAPAFVDQAVAAAPKTSVRGRTEPLSRLRKVIASRMTESLQTSAQLTTVLEADVTRIAQLRQRAKGSFEAREGTKLSFLPFFALATVEALKAHPVVELLDRRAGRHRDLPRGRAPGHRRRHRARPARPRHPERRRPEPRRDGPQDRRPRRAHPHQPGHAGRARRRDVHAHQHRLARRPVRHPDHQPAAGRHPRHGRRRQAPGRRGGPAPSARSSPCARWSTSR